MDTCIKDCNSLWKIASDCEIKLIDNIIIKEIHEMKFKISFKSIELNDCFVTKHVFKTF